MRQVDACLSPELIHLYDISDKTVVIVDILRATSCMVAGISTGVDHIIAFDNLEQCMAMKEKGYVTAGERGGQKVDGFDIGNSPFSYMEPGMNGRSVAVTTTNGTRAIELSKTAPEILIAAFLNLSATADHILKGDRDVLILCAAWKGRVNLEDSLFAGALSLLLLENNFTTECDATLLVTQVYQKASANLGQALENSSHVNRLKKFGIQRDIEFCTRIDEFDSVVGIEDGRIKRLS